MDDAEHPIGWRIPPAGRVAHWLTLANGYVDMFHTACGRTMILGWVTNAPKAKRCKKCNYARMANQDAGPIDLHSPEPE